MATIEITGQGENNHNSVRITLYVISDSILLEKMQRVEGLAIVLCMCMLAGLAMYALDILNIPGADHLIQQADARRSSHSCSPWPFCP